MSITEQAYEPGGAEQTPLRLIRKDLKAAAALLSKHDVRYLVDTYYQIQDFRIQAVGQVRAATAHVPSAENPVFCARCGELVADGWCEVQEPHDLLVHTAASMKEVEETIRQGLGAYSASRPLGQWAESICGIGPVISAGLLAHIDVEQAPTVGHIWRFAGLDPTVEWGKGEKRPWNAKLKVLCWKAGESFVKVQSNPNDHYGRVYVARKALEVERNEAGLFADQAAASLEKKRYGKDTEARKWYEAGKLPPARIHLRATRYATKLFLAHWHEVAYRLHHGELPPKPYAITHLGHAHLIPVPNLEVAGL